MISIVLGTFNRLPKLKRSLESIAREDVNAEVLVADGGSTDGTLEFLRSRPFGLDLKFIGEGALHGVTKCYNRLFRMANRPFLTWTSDDCRYEPGSLNALVVRIQAEPEKTLVGCYTDNSDGRGWVEFSSQKCCTIGGARKSLFQMVDYWSEDYLTYASDIDFSFKVNRVGGGVVFEKNAKVFHEMDSIDKLHDINNGENISSKRFANIFTDRNLRRFTNTGKIYGDIYLRAENINELMAAIEFARSNLSWGNYYTANDFDQLNLLNSMNVKIKEFEPLQYDLIVCNNEVSRGADRR